MLQIKIARSRGMCAGVERAIATVHEALTKYQNGRVYVLHEVVHNRHVVEDLKVAGAHFVDSLDEVPSDAVLIISAHGVGHETIDEINRLGIRYIDATCPVVSAIHRKVNKAGLQGLDVIVIGHRGHREVIGTVGQYTGDSSKVHVIITPEDVKSLDLDGDNVFFTTQTTLSVDETAKTVMALKERFPNIKGPKSDDTCRATQVRQNAVRELARQCDLVLIAGSANSSNSNRLKEIAVSEGVDAYLIDDFTQIDLKWFEHVEKIGISAGASAPEYVVTEIIDFLTDKYESTVEEIGSELKEKSFLLPEI